MVVDAMSGMVTRCARHGETSDYCWALPLGIRAHRNRLVARETPTHEYATIAA